MGDLTFEQLSDLAWPSGDSVLLVSGAVALTSSAVALVILDIKTYDVGGVPTNEAAVAGAVVGLLAAAGCSNCLVWAKSDAIVAAVKEALPAVPVRRPGRLYMTISAQLFVNCVAHVHVTGNLSSVNDLIICRTSAPLGWYAGTRAL